MLGGILNVLMSGLESVHLDRVTLAVSALWSLIHNNSKVQLLFDIKYVYTIASSDA